MSNGLENSANAALLTQPRFSILPGGEVHFGVQVGKVGACLPVLHWEITSDPELEEPLRHGLTQATDRGDGLRAEVTVIGLTPGRSYCGRFNLAGQSTPWVRFQMPAAYRGVHRYHPRPVSAA